MLFWLKVAHIAAVAVWFTGLLLLLRLFATRRRGGREARPDFFDPVANRLFFRVATPAGVLAIALGMSLIPGAQSGAWLLAKLCLVALVVLVHLWSGAHLHALGKGRARGRVLPAVLGWTPLLLLLAIAALTGAKPRGVGGLPPPGAQVVDDSAHSSNARSADEAASSRSRWP